MINVAVLGYGTVGSGVVEVIETNKEVIDKRAGEELHVKYILDLRDFPEREPNTTRIEVKFRYITENKIEVQITDLGFGEFFESSGMSVKKEVVLSEL